MNREILFKAKRIDWRDLPKEQWWVEGDVQHTTSKNIILIVVDDYKAYPCDSSTLCQIKDNCPCCISDPIETLSNKEYHNKYPARNILTLGNMKIYLCDYHLEQLKRMLEVE